MSYHTVSEGVPDLKKVLMGILGACVVIFLLLVVAGIIIDAFDGDDESESADIQSASTETAIGLGISRDAVEDAFSDFDLEDAPLKDGRERLLGEAPIGSVTLQLIGEDSNLEEAALVMTVYSNRDNSEVLRQTRLFLSTVLPGWAGGADWFEQGVIQIADDNRQNVEIETRHGDARITLTANKQWGFLTLKVESAQGSPSASNFSSPASTLVATSMPASTVIVEEPTAVVPAVVDNAALVAALRTDECPNEVEQGYILRARTNMTMLGTQYRVTGSAEQLVRNYRIIANEFASMNPPPSMHYIQDEMQEFADGIMAFADEYEKALKLQSPRHIKAAKEKLSALRNEGMVSIQSKEFCR